MISLAKRPLSDQTTNFREINSLWTISHTYLLGTQEHVNGIMLQDLQRIALYNIFVGTLLWELIAIII